eukprot:scaffold86896_cov63-Phaeocystis_antarctica.AAC.1
MIPYITLGRRLSQSVSQPVHQPASKVRSNAAAAPEQLDSAQLSQLARGVEHALRMRRDGVGRTAEDLGAVDGVVPDGEEARILLHAQLDGGRRAQVHLVGAVSQAQAARAREGGEEGRVLRETHRAMRLDAPVDEALHRDGYVRLDHAEHLPRARVLVAVRVHELRRLVHEQPAGLDLTARLRDVLQNGVEASELLAECFPLTHAAAHERERALRLTE